MTKINEARKRYNEARKRRIATECQVSGHQSWCACERPLLVRREEPRTMSTPAVVRVDCMKCSREVKP